MRNLWSEEEAAGLGPLDLLVYRSRLLGAPELVNPGGGNTSIKRRAIDFRGDEIAVLSIKASGRDLASATAASFVDVSLPDLLALQERDAMSDEEMVAYLSRCLLDPAAARPSIETLLHGFLPAPHIDHTHPELGLAIATARNGEALTHKLFGGDAVWIPYVRPGFAMARLAAGAVAAQPRARFAVLQKHGVVTWAGEGQACYLQTLEFLERVGGYLLTRRPAGRMGAKAPVTPLHGGLRVQSSGARAGGGEAAVMMPVLRGVLSNASPVVLAHDGSPEVLAFLASPGARDLAQRGLACPDHVIYTGVKPLFLEGGPETAGAAVEAYKRDYSAFFERHHSSGDRMRDPMPRVVLIPGAGVITAGPDAGAAAAALTCYRSALRIMRESEAAGGFAPLTEEEAYHVEYWPLELYKLSLRPRPKQLEGRVALVTGGAGAIGRAICQGFMEEGACVIVADIDGDRAATVAQALERVPGEGPQAGAPAPHGPWASPDSQAGAPAPHALGLQMDVTSEESVRAALARAVAAYGGLDILVCNAGVAYSHPLEETSVAEWQRTLDVLATGYFLTAREGVAVMRRQRRLDGSCLGGSVIFVASKAGLAAAKNAAAYASAKAAALHLARCLAEEVSGDGIRVNSLAPDAIIQGSGLWAGQWGAARAEAHGVAPERLAEFYEGRNMLKIGVTAKDVAEAALFFASERSRATTGAILTVDGGLHDGYVR